MIAMTLPKFTSTLLGRNATTANHTIPAQLPPQFFLNDQTFRHWFPSQEYIQSGRRSEKLAPLMNNVNGDSVFILSIGSVPLHYDSNDCNVVCVHRTFSRLLFFRQFMWNPGDQSWVYINIIYTAIQGNGIMDQWKICQMIIRIICHYIYFEPLIRWFLFDNLFQCMLCNTRERPMGGWRKCNPFRMLACKCQADMSHFLLQIALHSARNYEKKTLCHN